MAWGERRRRLRYARGRERRLREPDRLDGPSGLGTLPTTAPRRRPSRLSRVAVTALVLAAGAWGLTSTGYDQRVITAAREVLDRPAHNPHAPAAVQAGGSHAFMATRDDGEPVTFDPCRPVEIVINPQGAPEGYREMIDTAVRRTAEASGLDLVVVGESEDRDFLDRGRGDPVLVGWADEEEVPALSGTIAGLAGATTLEAPPAPPRAVSGMVVLDTATYSRSDVPHESLQAVVDHEFGHLVGLDHVEDPDELMHAEGSALRYGPGDLEGLARIGRSPCG